MLEKCFPNPLDLEEISEEVIICFWKRKKVDRDKNRHRRLEGRVYDEMLILTAVELTNFIVFFSPGTFCLLFGSQTCLV